MSVYIDLGNSTITQKGNYSASTMYEPLSRVRNNGSSWVAKKNTQGNEPVDNSSYWQLMVKDGLRGPNSTVSIGTITLSADRWDGRKKPYEYDLSFQLIAKLGNNYNDKDRVIITVDNDELTLEQISLINELNIFYDYNQKLYSYANNIPSIDIPCVIKIISQPNNSSVITLNN